MLGGRQQRRFYSGDAAVAGSAFITQPIPEPGPSLVRSAADRVEMSADSLPLAPEVLRDKVAGRDAVLCLLTDAIDASVLEAARGCRVFANMAVGYNNVDLDAATRLGVLVTNTPGVLTEGAAHPAWT